MKVMRSVIAVGAALIGISSGALAAPLAVTPTGPVVVVDETTLEFNTSINGGGFTIGDAFVFPGGTVSSTTDITLSGPAFIELFLDFDVADTADFGGSFCVYTNAFCAGADEVVSGGATELGFAENQIQILFNGLTGSDSGLFPGGSLATITFLDAIGADPLGSLQDGQSYRVSIALSGAAPIPLPGAALFLITGLGAAGAARLRKKGVTAG